MTPFEGESVDDDFNVLLYDDVDAPIDDEAPAAAAAADDDDDIGVDDDDDGGGIVLANVLFSTFLT